MKTFEEKFTAWTDGELTGQTLADFEAELAKIPNSETEKAAAHKLGDLLRAHGCAPELKNADFFNHQLMQTVESEQPRTEVPAPRVSSWWTLSRMVWAGAFSLAMAFGLYEFIIPRSAMENPTGEEYVSQILESTSDDPDISASSFESKKDNVTVLWLDGLDYVPENYKLK